mgnify:CR=1 FL=1
MHGEETWLSWVFKLINFVVLVAVLVKFGGKPLKNYLQNRSKAVKEKVEEADRLQKEAEALKKEYEAKLAKLDDEIEAFKASIFAQTEREKQKILDEANESAARIKQQAAATYQQEIREMTNRIKGEIAKLTMERAQKLVAERLVQKDHDRLVEEFIQKLRSLN